MTVLNIIRQTIFWLTILFIATSIFALTIGQALPIEFSSFKTRNNFYDFIFFALPFSLLLTLTGTIKMKHTKAKNWTIGVLTVLSAGFCFFFLIGIMFSVAFGAWTNEAILYRNKTNKTITINQQIYDEGALGYGGHRTVMLTPFLKYFQSVKEIDTSRVDKVKWLFVDEEGDIHYP